MALTAPDSGKYMLCANVIQCARVMVVCHMLMLHAVVRGGYQEWEFGRTLCPSQKKENACEMPFTHPLINIPLLDPAAEKAD
jgi:hypothetical protein